MERPPFRASTAAYWACGLLQLLVFVAYAWVTVRFTLWVGTWALGAEGAVATYGRGVLAGGLALGLACAIPILVKWVLVGRWRETEIRVWSAAYLRLWTVKSLLRISPIPFTAGTPIYNLFLRALGADVGRGALIVSRRMPLVTDLLTVGPGAVVRRNVLFNGYHAEAGRIRTGRVTIGAGAHVGEGSVLGLDVSIGEGARLGHASSLQDGEQVRVGERRDGFGVQHSGEADGIVVEPVAQKAMRPALFALYQVGAVVLVTIPLAAAVTIWLSTQYDARTGVFTGSLGAWQTYVVALAVGAVSYVGYLVVTFLIAVTLPRMLRPLLVPGRTYPLYGVRYWAQRTVERRSNQPFWVRLVGDSSYVVPYLRAVGYRMPDLVQTGSNFGSDVKHDNPFLTTVGSGTMIADGLSVINVDYSGSSFRLSDTAVGARSFLGNQIVYPPQAAVGEDCLLGTKVMVPMTGPLRTGTGLLGAPAFEIPRTVRRDAEFQHLAEGENLRRGLAAKNRHNLVSMALYALAASAGIAGSAWSPTPRWRWNRRSGRLPSRSPSWPPSPSGCCTSPSPSTPRERSGRSGRSTSRSTTAGSGHTSATGSSRSPRPRCSTGPRSSPSRGGSSASGSVAGSSTTAVRSSRRPSPRWVTTARSTCAAPCRRTRRRTVPSSPTGSSSAPGAPSAPHPSSTTAPSWVTASS